MNIASSIKSFSDKLKGTNCRLIAVSKTYPNEAIQEAYAAGQRVFGENRVQELAPKYEALPKDIEWHLIGHLQSNKVKYIASFVHMIHSVDSLKLLKEINKEGGKHNRIINVLLQIYIADEDTKFGLSFAEAEEILQVINPVDFSNVKIKGFMGMATNTDDQTQIRSEFLSLKTFADKCRNTFHQPNLDLQEISMGMSSDYKIAIEEGSTLIRVGSSIFGARG